MPVAVATRRKKGRQASEDIEEDTATQRGKARDTGREDVEDDDDEQPTRRVKQEKGKGVSKKKAKQEATQDADGDVPMEDNDADPPIDIDNFPAQPITRADCQKLKGLGEDWNSLKSILNDADEMLGSTGSAIVDSQSDEVEDSLVELDHLMRDFIDVGALIEGHSQAFSDIAQSVFRGEDVTDVKGQYLALMDESNKKYDTKTSRQKYAKKKEYTKFKQEIWTAQNPEEAMPPITELVPHEEGDESDDDDDIVVGGQTQEFKCPLLMTTLVDPYTSTVCKHSFSGEAIKDLFKNARGPLPCPTAGCSKSFTMAQCKPNPELAKEIKKRERRLRQRQQADESDDDEVIE
uniref:SP-RING-type domain-containing protein n=1 Tax=Mycena chlorophos TaxID=658473 RepID=A0ABQ0LIA7_MYCCL|nr:predicted protein [Mycena chlorophos]